MLEKVKGPVCLPGDTWLDGVIGSVHGGHTVGGN